MTLEYLRDFIALAELGNFTDAADQLFVSQSTLSRHIRAFEAELGVRLFTRTTKSVLLNEYGEKFYPYAQRILSVEEECVRSFNDEIHHMNGQLMIGAFVLDEPYQYTSIINQFRKEHGTYKINLIEKDISVLKDYVLNGICDFAIIASPTDCKLDGLEQITISRDTMVAVFPETHPVVEARKVDLEQLKDETVIIRTETDFFYQQYCTAMQKHGFIPNANFFDVNTKSVIKMVELGQGFTLRPKLLSMSKHNTATQFVDIDPAIEFNIDLIYCAGKHRSKAANDLIAFFCEALQIEK